MVPLRLPLKRIGWQPSRQNVLTAALVRCVVVLFVVSLVVRHIEAANIVASRSLAESNITTGAVLTSANAVCCHRMG